MGSPHEGGLNLSARHVGLIYGTLAIGATVSPLFVGLLADRLFATQRVLAALHLLGAGLLGGMLWASMVYAKEVRTVFFGLKLDEPVEHRPVRLDLKTISAELAETPFQTTLGHLIGEESLLVKYLNDPKSYMEPEDEYPFQSFLVRV